MSTRNRYSPLAVDEPLPPLPPSPEGHRVIEFEERPVTPAEELRTPSLVAIAGPSSTRDQRKASIHEVSITFFKLIFDRSANHMLL